jgi:hypothetical protein
VHAGADLKHRWARGASASARQAATCRDRGMARSTVFPVSGVINLDVN